MISKLKLPKPLKFKYLNTFLNSVFLLSLGLAFSQCTEDRLYEKNVDIKNAKWSIDSVLVFNFEIRDASSRYNLFYNIRNTLKYPYYNLYVNAYLEDSKGQTILTELQNVTLMDAKTGQPFGSGLGDTFAHQLAVPKFTNFKFPQAGKYTFRLKQYMRQDPLPGIVSMGLRIEKAN